MSKQEVQNLSDEDLKKHWDMVKDAYRMRLPQHLSDHQSLMLFADFVNISDEIKKREMYDRKTF